MDTGERVAESDVLSQYGSRTFMDEAGLPFRNRPRLKDRDAISLQAGAIPPLHLPTLCFGREPRDGDGVRLTSREKLEAAGFTVTATPNRRNPGHVSVQFAGDWTDEVAERFDACFTEGLFVSTTVESGKEVEGHE